MLTFDIITLFPEMFPSVLGASIIGRAQTEGRVRLRTHDLRDFSKGKYRQVDDRPFGGGPGMVLMADPIYKAVKKVRGRRRARVILMCAGGQPFSQRRARELAAEKNLVIVCGHYEGVDERVREAVIDESLSIGDYVLTGGELPAMVIVDAVTRLVPGVVGREASLGEESFENGLIEYPHYTRPAEWMGRSVPDVLLSGDHRKIAEWRHRQSVTRTRKIRPDLMT